MSERPTLSRRNFLRATGAGIAGAWLLANVPPTPGHAAEAAAASEALPTGGGWESLPIVHGEPLPTGETLNATLIQITGDIGLRDQPEAIGTRIPGEVGSIMNASQVGIPGQNGDPNTWAHGQIVYDGEQAIEGPTKYMATNLPNTLKHLDKPADVPEKLRAQFVSTAEEVPMSKSEFVAGQFAELFHTKLGGLTDTYERMATAWGADYTPGEMPLDESPVASWQRAATIAALDVAIDSVDSSRAVNVCAILGEEDSTCNFYRHVNAETGHVDVLSRMINRNDEAGGSIFVGTRFITDQDTGNIHAAGVFFATPEAVAQAYGPEADAIGNTITAITGDDVEDLAVGIASLEQTKVFLAGAAPGGVMADRLTLDPKHVNALKQQEVTPNGTHTYERVDGGYKAMLYGTQTGNTEPVLISQATYLAVGEQGNWLDMNRVAVAESAKRYMELTGTTVDDLMATAQVEVKTASKNGQQAAIVTHNGMPVLVGDIEKGVMVEATGRTLLQGAGITFGGSADGAENWRDPGYQSALGRHFGLLKAEGFNPEMINQWNMPDNWERVAVQQKMKLYPGALFSHYDVDPAIKNGASKTEVEASMDSRIREVLGSMKEVGGGMVDVISEAMWVYQGNRGWENSIYYQTFGESVIAEAYVRAFNIAQEMGMEVGKDIELIYNDYSIEIPGPKSDFVFEQLTQTKQEIAQRLGIQVDQVRIGVGIESHIKTDPNDTNVGGVNAQELTAEKFISNAQRFAQIGPVHVTELQVNHSQNVEEIQHYLQMVVQAALQSGVVDSITLYQPLRYSNIWNAINSGLFEEVKTGMKVFKPSQAYYDLLQTMYQTVYS